MSANTTARKLFDDVAVEASTNGRIPPGPTIFYFIRNGKAMTDPHRILGVFRSIVEKYGDVCAFRSGLIERTYLVADPRIMTKVFTATQAFTKYPQPAVDIQKLQALIGKGMLATHMDSEWESHRRSMTKSFNPSYVFNHYYTILCKHLDRLLAEIGSCEGGKVVNISEISILFSGRVMSEILSPRHPVSDADFMEIKRILDESILEFHKSDFIRRAKKYKEALMRQAEKLLESHLRGGAEDFGLVSVMLRSLDGGLEKPENRQKLLEQILNMIVAGYETTSTTINWIFYMLAMHPEVAQEAHEEVVAKVRAPYPTREDIERLTFVNNVVLETMRIYSVLWFNIRYAVEDVVVDGYLFKKGSRVMLLPFIGNRCAKYIHDAEEFKPERYTTGAYEPLFPFGHGPRLCIGKSLAELELRLMTAKFARHFRFEPISHPVPIGGVLLQPSEDILVKMTRRSG
ncbi:cytochrome P450 [Sorangium sp. So ce119]|uniref:cytochrome P450 n=1 Tax=Sorangium sp. So ce119 TaxID=3133279 RepID=UPI003F60273C